MGLKRTPLKRKTPLKRSRINPVNKKQAKKNRELARTKSSLVVDRCHACGDLPDFRGLSVHHIKKRSQGGGHEESNLKILCGKCHSKEHGVNEIL